MGLGGVVPTSRRGDTPAMLDAVVALSGNATRDPELRFTVNGHARATFGVGVNRRWRDSAGEWQESTSFVEVVAWGPLAENVAATLEKGSRVVVTGRLEQRSWENDAGEKRSKVEVVAEDVGPSLRWATATVRRVLRDDRAADRVPAGVGASSAADSGEVPF